MNLFGAQCAQQPAKADERNQAAVPIVASPHPPQDRRKETSHVA